jgi:hypothetical protein
MQCHTNANTAERNRETIPDSPAVYTPAEFALLLHRHPSFGYRKIYNGEVRVLKHSGRLLIPRHEVEKFLSKTVVYNGKPGKLPGARTLKSGATHG